MVLIYHYRQRSGGGGWKKKYFCFFFCSNSRGFALFITNKRRNAKDLRWVLFQALFPFFFFLPAMDAKNKQMAVKCMTHKHKLKRGSIWPFPSPWSYLQTWKSKNMLFCPCRLAWHWPQLFDTSLFILTYYTKGLKAMSLCFMCNKQDISDLFPL